MGSDINILLWRTSADKEEDEEEEDGAHSPVQSTPYHREIE
jgi:hypothetical protein